MKIRDLFKKSIISNKLNFVKSKALISLNSLRYWQIITSFVIVVLCFATVYLILCQFGHGIVVTQEPLRKCNFGDCLYFSVVTITSLGYGDMHPISSARIFSCFEVLIGLLYLGIFISKLTSPKQTYLLHRIYSSLIRGKIKELCLKVEHVYSEYKEISDYMNSTIKDENSVVNIDVHKKIRANNKKLFQTIKLVTRSLDFEINQTYYYIVIPHGSLANLIDSVASIFNQLLRFSAPAKLKFLEESNYSIFKTQFDVIKPFIIILKNYCKRGYIQTKCRVLEDKHDRVIRNLGLTNEYYAYLKNKVNEYFQNQKEETK